MRLGILALLTSCSLLNAAPSEDLSQLVKDHTQFAFSLYKQANSAEENFLFSPYSIATNLSIVYLGARGETQSQMERVLQLGVDQKSLAKTTSQLNDSLLPQTGSKEAYRITPANALWVDQGIFLLTDFRYAIEKQLKASLNKINFTKKQQALATINGWVDQQTNHKIPQILSEEDLNELTRLVLVNALYFQGNWKFPFDTSHTHDWPFHPTPDTSIPTKMMQQAASLPYYENELVQVTALPFQGKSTGGGELAFVVILPRSAENLEMAQKELLSEFSNWITALKPMQLDLKLPKFTQNTRLNLNNTLKEMGMTDPFESDADFTGIDGMRDLFLNTIIHQAYLQLDEKGVVASAATAATMGVTSSGQKIAAIPFYADHPFLYFILDLKSQEILFMGNLTLPFSEKTAQLGSK